jgi:hypothetical protein
VEISGVQQPRFAVINENVRAARDVAGIIEGDLVAGRHKGFTVAVPLFNLTEAGDVSFGKRTPHGSSMQF